MLRKHKSLNREPIILMYGWEVLLQQMQESKRKEIKCFRGIKLKRFRA